VFTTRVLSISPSTIHMTVAKPGYALTVHIHNRADIHLASQLTRVVQLYCLASVNTFTFWWPCFFPFHTLPITRATASHSNAALKQRDSSNTTNDMADRSRDSAYGRGRWSPGSLHSSRYAPVITGYMMPPPSFRPTSHQQSTGSQATREYSAYPSRADTEYATRAERRAGARASADDYPYASQRTPPTYSDSAFRYEPTQRQDHAKHAARAAGRAVARACAYDLMDFIPGNPSRGSSASSGYVPGLSSSESTTSSRSSDRYASIRSASTAFEAGNDYPTPASLRRSATPASMIPMSGPHDYLDPFVYLRIDSSRSSSSLALSDRSSGRRENSTTGYTQPSSGRGGTFSY